MGGDGVMGDPRALAAVRAALAEDIGDGDATTRALVDPRIEATAALLTREPCRVAGVSVGQAAFLCVDEELRVETLLPDGHAAAAGEALMTVRGRAASILTAERTALNFMQRLCGIATLTARFAEAVKPYGTLILDTRKTTPNLRQFEKYAVTCGGGVNHRFGLYDRVLIKDNHRRLWQGHDPDRLDLAVAAARKAYPALAVEVEVESVAECVSALRGRPEWIMLDNMDCGRMRECVALCRGKAKTEASGGITLDRAREVAATGVDAISLGCLTHSAPSVDLSLEWSRV
ncbi:MAG: carboxylating nicotinate-nucleotide diphosphorylase [Kiritimatiellia bacterium]|jgi:nicotinate-nucleotide pyrophosphorylase (carboxylating)|nr:carboxylating nicotinate-nucleotide diphosphorylase [Kiritimatiellia bacterium]